MKKKVLLSLLLLILVVGTLVAGCAEPAPAPTPTPTRTPTPTPTPTPEPAEPILLKFASHNPPLGISEVWYREEWGPKIAELTNGRVKIDFYFGETLGKSADSWRMVTSGIADIAFIVPVFFPGSFPMSECGNVPGFWPIRETDLAWSIVSEIWDKFLYQEYSEVKMLWLVLSTPGHAIQTTKKPIRTLDDIKGLQIGVPSGMMGRTAEALGGTPIDLPPTEAYLALERGLIDGYAFPTNGFKPFKLYETTKYHTFVDFGGSFFLFPMNLKTWNSLPADIQKVFEDTRPWTTENLLRINKEEAAVAIGIYKEAGLEIIYLSPEDEEKRKELQKVVAEEWIEDLAAKGLPGQEMWDEAQRLAAAGLK